MAYANTFTSLLTEVQTYVDDDVGEFVAQLPNMVGRAQDRIQLDLTLERWNTDIEDSFTAASNQLARQPSWLRINSIFVPSTGRYLERRTPEWCRMFGTDAVAGIPRYWAENKEGTVLVAQTPHLNTNIIVNVMKRLPALSATNQTNFITDNLGACLLWATLKEAEHFLIAPERVAEFEANYMEELNKARETLFGVQRRDYRNPSPAARAGG